MVLDITAEDDIKSLTYVIQNIVVKASLNVEKEIDLNKILGNIENTEYNSGRFPGLFIRFKHPKCVVIVFRNGKMIITGLKLFYQINLALSRLILKFNEIFEFHIDINSIQPKVVNIVITANFYKQINLDLAALKLNNTIYEPEVFPGLIYRSRTPIKSVFLIFSTGKIVFTGIREKTVIKPALINLGRLLSDEKLFVVS